MAECTIYDKLRYIAETKDLIKTAIETQDVEVLESDTFRKYAEYITEIRKVASVNGETGDIILKTINGQNLVGEGNISIQGGEGGGGITEETDPIFTEWKNGTAIALGKDSTNEGSNNIAIGNAVKANGEYSIAIGAATIYDEGTEYEEIYPTEANGEGSIAIGNETIANNASLTIGSYNNINNASVALGMWNTITSDNSLAVGNNNSLEGGSFKFAYGFFNEPKNNQEINIGVLCKSRTGNTDSERTHFVISSYNNRNGEDNTSCFEIRNDDSIYIKMDGQLVKLQDKLNINVPETDLSDYYTKGEVYNKNEVNELIDEVNAGDVDLTNYYTKQEVDDKIPSLSGYATEQWVEGKNYLTEHQSLEDYAKKTDIPTKTSELVNDSNFLTEHQSLEDYAKKSDIPDVSEFIKEIPSEYITEEELNGKGYLTSIPDTYVTDGELSTAISDKVSQIALIEAIEGVENKIPSLDGYATEQWVEDKKYLTEHQSLEDYAKKSDIPTIPTSNTAFTNDAGFITIDEVPETDLTDYYTKSETYSKDDVDDLLENSGGGVNKIILGDEDYGWNTYKDDVKLTNGWVDLDDDGVSETYDIRVGDNSGSSLWFGFNSTDNSIKIEDNGSRLSFTVNPDILGGGGTAGVEAINIGRDIQDWTQKTGIVSMYTDWYDGSYDVGIGGTSFFGIKPIDDSIILEYAGGTVNGNSRCGIKVNPDILGGNAPTLQEGKSGTTDNYIYSDGDQNSNNCVMASFALRNTATSSRVSIDGDVKLWGDTSFNGKTNTYINGATQEKAGVMTAEDKKNLDALVANSGNTGGSDLISINANNSSDSLNVGSGNTGDLYGTILVGRNIVNNYNAAVLIGNGVTNTVGDRTGMAVNICNSLMADSSGTMYFWKNGKVEKLADYAVYKEWSGTQTEYNALGTYDDNTIYNIIEG